MKSQNLCAKINCAFLLSAFGAKNSRNNFSKLGNETFHSVFQRINRLSPKSTCTIIVTFHGVGKGSIWKATPGNIEIQQCGQYLAILCAEGPMKGVGSWARGVNLESHTGNCEGAYTPSGAQRNVLRQQIDHCVSLSNVYIKCVVMLLGFMIQQLTNGDSCVVHANNCVGKSWRARCKQSLIL